MPLQRRHYNFNVNLRDYGETLFASQNISKCLNGLNRCYERRKPSVANDDAVQRCRSPVGNAMETSSVCLTVPITSFPRFRIKVRGRPNRTRVDCSHNVCRSGSGANGSRLPWHVFCRWKTTFWFCPWAESWYSSRGC